MNRNCIRQRFPGSIEPMKYFLETTVLLLLVLGVPSFVWCGQELFREDFNSLDDWVPVVFPKIKRHTFYGIEQTDSGSVLVAKSDASASGIRYVKEFDVFAYPVVRWRWKVENVYQNGDVERKSGDDYPLRVYIIFKYDPQQASFGDRITYGLAKAVYGAYPPHSSLNYIWANREHDRSLYTSKYTDRAKMIILRAGKEETGRWFEEEINIVTDYKKAFGTQPPATASLAIMNDSDNTGEASVSYMDYILVRAED